MQQDILHVDRTIYPTGLYSEAYHGFTGFSPKKNKKFESHNKEKYERPLLLHYTL